MTTNVSYLTYEFADNPAGNPTSWVAQSVADADPVPDSPWVTVSAAAFADLMVTQQSEYAASRADAIETSRREGTVLQAWKAAWDYVNIWYDYGGLLRFVTWLIDPNASPTGKSMIAEIRAWIDAVMHSYLFDYKPGLLEGDIIVIDYAGANGNAPYTFTQILNACNTPWFTTQPSNDTKLRGLTASFTVVTSGYPTRTYQWQRSNDGGTTWADVGGATSATYSFSCVIGDNGAQFKCKCQTSTASVACSTSATLTVL